MPKTPEQIIKELKEKYKDDAEALEEINRTEIDIKYAQEQEEKGNYNGQPAIGIAKMLVDDLKVWF